VTLGEMVGRMAKSLFLFRKYWVEMYAQDKERFPLVVSEAEWVEQFEAWCESCDDETS